MDKLKVSTYIRVSTGRQAREGDSLEEQESELKKFCEYKNYLIHKMHIERGRSAKDTNRPEYQKLLEEIKEKKVNAVVVKKLDRLSRSLLDFEDFMQIAQKNDVEFISLKENFDTTNAMGKAMLRIALVFAQLEREQNSERVIDVMTYRAEQGLFNGGTAPYGYDVINKELVPHKQERKIIELIFDKFIETRSTVLVAKELNAIGARTRNNMLWDKRGIDYLLRNPVYLGKVKWNGQLFPALHQPIITETKMQLVKEIFENKKFINSNNKTAGLLKGLLICGYCEKNLSPSYARKKNKKYFYYRCGSTFNKNGYDSKCSGLYIPFEKVHALVIERLLEYAKEEKLSLIKSKIDKHNKQIEKQTTLLKTELGNHELFLSNTKNKKEKYLDSLISGNFSKSERERINQKIDDFSLEEKQIQASIYRLQFELNEEQEKIISLEPFKQEIIKLKLNYENMERADLHAWLKKNISKIIYKEDDVEIVFKSIGLGS